jgi:hypothetical protein
VKNSRIKSALAIFIGEKFVQFIFTFRAPSRTRRSSWYENLNHLLYCIPESF